MLTNAALLASVSPPPNRLACVMDEPLLAWHRLETTPLNAAYYLRLASGQEQVLWINQRDQEPRVERYVAAIDLLPNLTPPLVRADTTCERLEYPYLLTRYLPEPTLAQAWSRFNAAQREQAARSWGHALRLIHRVRFEWAGDLALPEVEGERLETYLETAWRRLLPLTSSDDTVDTAALTSALERTRALLCDAPVTLCHGSAAAHNVLWSDAHTRVTSSVDFKRAQRSDPMTDLAALWDEVQKLGCEDAFVQGYGALSRWEKLRLSVYKLHHALECYAEALRCDPRQIARWRRRLAAAVQEVSQLPC